MSDLTHERLTEVLHYKPTTGIFTWKIAKSSRAQPGQVAGYDRGECGYRGVRIDGTCYQAHRLAWFYVHGAWPIGEIDHINGIRHDNRISNLRDVPRLMNSQNLRRATQQNRNTNLLGAHWVKKNKNWVAHIRVHGKARHLGVFPTAHAAHEAYVEAKRRLHEGNTL